MTLGKRQALSSLYENGVEHEMCGKRVSRGSSTTANFRPMKLVKGTLDSMRQSHCISFLVYSLWLDRTVSFAAMDEIDTPMWVGFESLIALK
jgi:hypothetical protein